MKGARHPFCCSPPPQLVTGDAAGVFGLTGASERVSRVCRGSDSSSGGRARGSDQWRRHRSHSECATGLRFKPRPVLSEPSCFFLFRRGVCTEDHGARFCVASSPARARLAARRGQKKRHHARLLLTPVTLLTASDILRASNKCLLIASTSFALTLSKHPQLSS